MNIEEKLKERQQVIETLQSLKNEKEKIEETVKQECHTLLEAFRHRETNNDSVQKLKLKRNNAAKKGNQSGRALKKQFTELETKWETGGISSKKEKQTMKRLGELSNLIKEQSGTAPDATEIHDQMIEHGVLADEANSLLAEALDLIAEETVTYEGLIIKRQKMHRRFGELNIDIKSHFDAKHEKKVGLTEEQTTDFLTRLKDGETLNLADFAFGGI